MNPRFKGISNQGFFRIAKIVIGSKEKAEELAIDAMSQHSMGSSYPKSYIDVIYSLKKTGPMPGVFQTESLGSDEIWYLVHTYIEKEDIGAYYGIINGEAYLLEPSIIEG